MENNMRPIRFGFDDVGPFDGFTDGSTWNGWLNVWATPETHAKIVQQFRGFHLNHRSNDFDGLEAGKDGLVSYANCYTITEWEDDEPTPYQKWVDTREKVGNLGILADEMDGREGLIYHGNDWIEATKTKDGHDWKFSTTVGNQEFESQHLGAVEWWLWKAWVSDQQNETPEPEPETVNRKIIIESCNGCPSKEHSGAFTNGGAYPLCHAVKRPASVRREPDYCGPMMVLPFEVKDDGRGRAVRVHTGEIPDWCPLPRDGHE